MNNSKSWDKVSQYFDTYQKKPGRGAADNVETAWPVLLKLIKKQLRNRRGLKALDFGCGAGMFCRELNKVGFGVTGIDLSPKMVKIGKKNLKGIKLLVGNSTTAKAEAKKINGFDLVTSIMVFQFIKETDLKKLAGCVKEKGFMIFVTHNPKRQEEKGVSNKLNMGSMTVPLFLRSNKQYDTIFKSYGFKKIGESYAKQSREFLKKYDIKHNQKNPKYMILGYKKT